MRQECFTRLLIAVASMAAALSCGGCGIVSIFGTPTRHEKKIAAEYDLAGRRNEKILVLVDQPAWLDSEVNLRYHLTKRLNDKLLKSVRIPVPHLTSYEELSGLRAARPDFASLSPSQVASALDADVVLFVMIEACQLERVAETSYYRGAMSVRSALYDAATAAQLWPESPNGKTVRVGFDMESRSREAAVQRLAAAAAHCIVRYLYDCPQAQFGISDDKSAVEW
ncbi:MAG TPA: hypothetical protein VMX13_11665 [Sedimentisphaerales bacterium]|nr:hypothetical protein [Sedimentisphaerales bacterium]